MASLYTISERNSLRTWVYLALFFVFFILIGWFISHLMGTQIILWIAVALAVIMNLIAYWYSDKIVLRLSKAKEVKKEEAPELFRVTENLCIASGLPMPRLYLIEEAQPNAFATGRDPKHGVIVVTKGLLDRLDRSELEGVIAHELAHIGNRDILLSTAIVVLVGAIVLLTDMFFRMVFWGSLMGRRDGQGGIIMLVIALALLIIAPLFAYMMKFAISRKREFLADATGALLTRYPDGLARALEKISHDPNSMKTANDATAHMYFVNPFRGKEAKAWLHKLFMTHPPVDERVRALRGMNVER